MAWELWGMLVSEYEEKPNMLVGDHFTDILD